jgi:hypothetical protein
MGWAKALLICLLQPKPSTFAVLGFFIDESADKGESIAVLNLRSFLSRQSFAAAQPKAAQSTPPKTIFAVTLCPKRSSGIESMLCRKKMFLNFSVTEAEVLKNSR